MTDLMPAATGVTVNTAPPSGMTSGEAGNISFHLGSLTSAVDSVKLAVADVRQNQAISFAVIKETNQSLTELLVNHEGLRQRVGSVEGDVGEIKISVEDLKQGKWTRAGIASAVGAAVFAVGQALPFLATWLKTKVVP